jgi:hypothetical protein
LIKSRLRGLCATGVLGLLAAAPAVGSSPAPAACWTRIASEFGPGSDFGRAVAMYGGVAVAGAPDDALLGDETGALWIAGRSGLAWSGIQTFRLPGAVENDRLGDVVAVGSAGGSATIALGVPRRESFRGRAFVLEPAQGGEFRVSAELAAPDADAFDVFGFAVGAGDGFVAVGAPGDDDAGQASGAVWLYTRESDGPWSPRTKLIPPAGDGVNAGLGTAIAARGSLLAAGAPGRGFARVYVVDADAGTATPLAQIDAPAETSGGSFGTAVAIHAGGDGVVRLAVSGELPGGVGVVYLYEAASDGWVSSGRFAADSAGTGFGLSVALTGSSALIGEPEVDGPGGGSGDGLDAGAVHRFTQTDTGDWFESATWTMPMPTTPSGAGDEFGFAVAADGDDALVGAWLDDRAGNDAGAAVFFGGLLGIDCNGNGTPDACDVAFGCSRDDDGNGVLDECDTRIFVADLTGPNLDGVPDGVIDAADLAFYIDRWVEGQ